LIRDNVSVAGVHLGRMTNTERLREDATALMRMYGEGAVRPVIGRVFPLAEAAEAHRFIQRRENLGKVLLEVAREE
jgi:NADPH:quinone reductase